jgi:DNA polymerase I-like protein with 3'-5' exonuclease and polymerase domains
MSRYSKETKRYIHDEIIVEAPVAETNSVAQILWESMIDAGKIFLKDVPVLVDVSVVDKGNAVFVRGIGFRRPIFP